MKKVPLGPEHVKGLDVSHYDESIDFAQVKAAGYEFVWAKATEGTGVTDARFAGNRAKAKAQGLLFGAYHFFRPGLDPIAQAQHFLKVAAIEQGDLLPMFDWEVTQGRGDIAKAQRFLDFVEHTIGKKMVIYGPPYMLNDLRLPASFADYSLCVAHYHVAAPLIPAPWTHCSFWQFNDKGSVPGIPAADEDLDLWNGTLDQLQKMIV